MFSVPFLFAQRVRVKIRTEKRKQTETIGPGGKMRRRPTDCVCSVLTLCHDVSNERGQGVKLFISHFVPQIYYTKHILRYYIFYTYWSVLIVHLPSKVVLVVLIETCTVLH